MRVLLELSFFSIILFSYNAEAIEPNYAELIEKLPVGVFTGITQGDSKSCTVEIKQAWDNKPKSRMIRMINSVMIFDQTNDVEFSKQKSGFTFKEIYSWAECCHSGGQTISELSFSFINSSVGLNSVSLRENQDIFDEVLKETTGIETIIDRKCILNQSIEM